jgi:hypothetical protein
MGEIVGNALIGSEFFGKASQDATGKTDIARANVNIGQGTKLYKSV